MANCLPSKQRIRVRFPLSALAIRIFCARRNSVLLDSCTLLASCALHQDALACDLYQLMRDASHASQDKICLLCCATFLRASCVLRSHVKLSRASEARKKHAIASHHAIATFGRPCEGSTEGSIT